MLELKFYVAPQGDDRWSGTQPEANSNHTDGPFATLHRARRAVRDVRSQMKESILPSGPVTVLVREGKYYLPQTLILGPEDSGSADCPVTYQAYPGEKPVLSGGRVLSGWRPYQGKILQCALPAARGGKWKFRQLFLSAADDQPGQLLPRARYPKRDPANPLYGGWAFTEAAADDGENRAWRFQDGVGWHMQPEMEGGIANAFRAKEGFFPRRWAKPAEGEVCIFLGFGWGYEILPVREVDEAARVITFQREILQWDRSQWFTGKSFSPNLRFYVENMLEDLTEPGEWCLDSEMGTVYFWPPEGINEFTAEGAEFPNVAPAAREISAAGVKLQVVAPHLQCLVELRGAAWVTLSGFTFSETQTGEDMLREDGAGYGAFYPRQGLRYCGEALHLKRAEHCRVERCQFSGLGGNAIYLEGYNYRNTIAHNEIQQVGANGICVIGSLQRHPLFNEVTDNDIHHCGLLFKLVAGVYLGASDGNRIAHNYIHHMPHHAVNLGGSGCGRNLVEYNEIRYIALESMDTGAINSWGDVPIEEPRRDVERCGHVIRYNLIADPIGCHLDSRTGEITAPDPTFTNGIYLDDYTSNCFVYGNVVLRSGIGIMLHGGKNNFCENNVLVDCRYPMRYFDSASERYANWQMPGFMRGNTFCRNIIYSTTGGPVMQNLGYRFSPQVIGRSDENLYWHSAEGDYLVENPGQAEKYSLAEWQKMGYDRASQTADPLFVDLPGEDFRLQPGSPAFELGIQSLDLKKVGVRPV